MNRIKSMAMLSLIAIPTAAIATEHDEGNLFADVTRVSAASRFEQVEEEAPASITVVSAEEIRRHGYQTLEEVLDSVRGFSVTNDRNYGTIGIRGFSRGGDYNSRLLLLLDGMRVNTNLYGEADYGRGGIVDVAMIDRVEVIRGPSSSIYGAGAFFGVINVVTKRGRDIAGVELEAGIGGRRASELRVTTGNRLDSGLEYVFSASGFGTRGEGALYYPQFDAAGTAFGVARDADGERARRLHGKVRWGDFSLTAGQVERDKVVPTAAFGTVFGDTRFRTRDERQFVEGRYDGAINDSTRLRLSASWNVSRYIADYPFNFPPIAINSDRAEGRWWILDGQMTVQASAKHLLTGGIEYQRNTAIEQLNFDTVSRLNDLRRDRQYGFYLQDEWRFAPWGLLNAGVRYDNYATFGGTTNPRVALVLQPARRSTVKLMLGRAFRAPNAYELYYSDGLLYAANPNLAPERIQSRELVLEQRFGNGFSLTANLYRNQISNFIQQLTDPGTGFLVFQNLGGLTTRGWELEGRWRSTSDMEVRASYVRQNSQDVITGSRVAGPAAWSGKLHVSVPMVGNRASVAGSIRSVSSRPTLAGNSIGAFSVVDVFVRYSPETIRHSTVSMGLSNLFNRRYSDPGGAEHRQDSIPQNGRGWRVQWEIGF